MSDPPDNADDDGSEDCNNIHYLRMAMVEKLVEHVEESHSGNLNRNIREVEGNVGDRTNE